MSSGGEWTETVAGNCCCGSVPFCCPDGVAVNLTVEITLKGACNATYAGVVTHPQNQNSRWDGIVSRQSGDGPTELGVTFQCTVVSGSPPTLEWRFSIASLATSCLGPAGFSESTVTPGDVETQCGPLDVSFSSPSFDATVTE